MCLKELKHGNEFICWWWLDDGSAEVRVCKWDAISESFVRFISSQKVCGLKTDYAYIHNPEQFFSYTTCVSSDGSQVSFDKVK